MAKIEVAGMDVFLADLRKLSQEARNINKGALGEGAKVAVELYGEAIESLPIRPDKLTGRQHSERLYGVTESEYAQLCNSYGIARFRNTSGGWNTSIGVSGYINTPSAQYGDQVPARLLLAAVDGGTEFRKPARVMSKASRSMKSEVEEAMRDYIDKKVNEIMGQ